VRDHWPEGVFQCGVNGPKGPFSVGSLARAKGSFSCTDRDHCETLKSAEEWRVSIRHMNERERQRTQRGKIMAAIQEVQADQVF
jgi:hypothetical protein